MTKRLSERGHATLRETVRRVRENLPFDRSITREPSTDTIETHYVQITSTTQSDGRYPGKRYNRNEVTKAFEDSGEFCWLVSPNGETLSTSTTYGVRVSQPHTDGLMVYVALGPFSGASSLLLADCSTPSLPAFTQSGDGLTLTMNSNGALTSTNFDTVTPTVGLRALYNPYGGSTSSGLYEITQVGDASHPGILTRTADANSVAELQWGANFIFVTGGNRARTLWQQINSVAGLTSSMHWLKVYGRSGVGQSFSSDQSSFDYFDCEFCSLGAGASFKITGIKAPRYSGQLLVLSANSNNSGSVISITTAAATLPFTYGEQGIDLPIYYGQSVVLIGDSGAWRVIAYPVNRRVTSISANTNANSAHETILVTTGAGGVTVTLPTASSASAVGPAKFFDIFKVDNGVGALTIAPNGVGTDTINGVNANKTISTQFAGARFMVISSTGWLATSLVNL